MNKKELLIELCANLEKDLNARDNHIAKIKVVFVSGLKPANYYLPMMHIGTTATLPDKVKMAYFVEVWVDHKCIFRESWMPHETEDLGRIESILMNRILRHVFSFGIMSSKLYFDKLEKP